jgi:FixJ family two-component response regulator
MEEGPVVLIVDDDSTICLAVESLARSIGLAARSFPSAEEFLRAAPSDRPACLVLDIDLPGLSGLDLQQVLRARSVQLPIVFLSANGDVPTSVRAIKAGAVAFLPKPFREPDLLAAIREALECARLTRQARDDSSELRERYEQLTPRQREAMTLVVAGLINKQIADRMGICEGTVKIHRGEVMRRMRAKSVAYLVRMADRLVSSAQRPGAYQEGLTTKVW